MAGYGGRGGETQWRSSPDKGTKEVRRLRASRRYAPGPYPGRITLYRPTAGTLAQAERWRSLAAGGADVQEVPGDHDTMLRPPQVESLARHLATALATPPQEGTDQE
jgi:thioesterase domain-containing protein